MARIPKKTTPKIKRMATSATPKKVERTTVNSWEETFDARKLLVIPLLALAIYCIYLVTRSLGGFTAIYSSPFEIFMFMPLPAILVVAFSCLAIYMLLKGKSIGKVATVIAWILILAIGWLALASLASAFPGSNPSMCEGLFGVMQKCVDVGGLQAYVLLFNPFSLAFYSLLSIGGIGVMVVRLKKW